MLMRRSQNNLARSRDPEDAGRRDDKAVAEEFHQSLDWNARCVAVLFTLPPTILTCMRTGVDIHKDTPTEILHTILLGIVKYFWGQTVWILAKEKQMKVFEARLAGLDAQGLNIMKINAEYVCKYKGGLIGKHFKSFVQIMPFVIYDLVSEQVLTAWNT
jgi:hypothetical protein